MTKLQIESEIKTVYEVKYWGGETLGVYATEAQAYAASSKYYKQAVDGGVKWAAQHGTPQTVIVRYSRGWKTVVGGHGAGFYRSKSKRAASPAITA